MILIPGWINVEINDSKARHNYIEQLIADDLPGFFIDEKDYEILFDYKTAYLYKLFLYSSNDEFCQMIKDEFLHIIF